MTQRAFFRYWQAKAEYPLPEIADRAWAEGQRERQYGRAAQVKELTISLTFCLAYH